MNDDEAAELEDEVRHELSLITAMTNGVIPKLRRLNAHREARGLPAIVVRFPRPEGDDGE